MTPQKKTPAPLPTLESELKAAMAKVAELEKVFVIDERDKVKNALAEEAAKRLQRDTNDMRQSLMRPECRRVIYRVLEESKTFAASFVPGHADVTSFNEGARSIGMFIMKLAELAEPGICLKMARENDSDKISAENRNKKITGAENEY